MLPCACTGVECCEPPLYGYQSQPPFVVVYNPDSVSYWALQLIKFGGAKTLDWSKQMVLAPPALILQKLFDPDDNLWYSFQLRGVGAFQTLDWSTAVAAPAKPNGFTDLPFLSPFLGTWPKLKLVGVGALNRTVDFTNVLP